MPLTLVMAARPATAGDPAEPLTLLRDDPHMSVLHPQPFSEDATASVVRRTLGEDAEQGFCAACHEATGGNPFFLGELLETARTQLARAHADLGTALRRAGRRREAQQELRTALDLADRCGGRVIAERARSELLVTGARPRRARLSGVEALTASERRVARLAAEGLTNRQIAQALFVSQPTVATHLSHCYQKLGISAREQLAGVLTGGVPGDG